MIKSRVIIEIDKTKTHKILFILSPDSIYNLYNCYILNDKMEKEKVLTNGDFSVLLDQILEYLNQWGTIISID